MAADNSNLDLLIVNEESINDDSSLIVDCAVFEHQGDNYISTERAVPASLISRIRDTVMQSKNKVGPDLKDFDISEAKLAQNLDLMVATASDGKYCTISEFPEQLRKFFDYLQVSQYAIEKLFTQASHGVGNTKITLTMPFEIVISSSHYFSLRLPWTITAEGASWLCYDRNLSTLLAEVVSEAGAVVLQQKIVWHDNDRNSPWDGKKVKQEDFFTHYGRWIRHQFEAYQIQDAAALLPGFEKSGHLLTVDQTAPTGHFAVQSGDYFFEKQPYLRLKSVNGALVDAVGWVAQGSWDDLLNRYARIEKAAKLTEWLEKWKAAAPHRSIFVEILNDKHESWREDEGLTEIWNQHDISGDPEYHFYLRENQSCKYDVFAGLPFDKFLVTTLGAERGGGCEVVFDKLVINNPAYVNRHMAAQFFVPQPEIKSRSYAIVDNAGAVIYKNQSAESDEDITAAVVSPPQDLEEEGAIDRRKDPYTWDEVEDLRERSLYGSPAVDGPDAMKLGLIGRLGTIILAPQFSFIAAFSEGLAKVRGDDGKYGFINRNGAIVIEPIYDYAGQFKNGLTVASKAGKWGYIDTTGDTKIPFIYENAHPFYEGLAAVKYNYRYGYIDQSGNWIITPRYSRARRFRDGLALIKIDGKSGYITPAGALLGDCFYNKIGVFWEGLASFFDGKLYGYIDTTGKKVIASQYKQAQSFRDGIAQVIAEATDEEAADSQNGKGHSHFIDTSGQKVNPPDSFGSSVMELHSEVLKVRERALKRFAEMQVETPVDLFMSYSTAGWFKDGLCPIEYNGKQGAININGALVIPAKFDVLGEKERDWFAEGLIPASEDGKWGVLDVTGAYIFKTDFDQIGMYQRGLAAVLQGTKYGFINTRGEIIVAPQFDTVGKFDQFGLALVGVRKRDIVPIIPTSFI